MSDELAEQVITAYLERQTEAARVAAEKATVEHHQAYEISAAWDERRQWTPRVASGIDLAAYSLVGAMDSTLQAAGFAAIDRPTQTNLAAYEDAKARADAVRAWLRARGIDWGETEQPTAKKRR